MRILHSADWHLDSPLVGFTSEQKQILRRALLAVPGKIAELCRREDCDLLLLSGDLFDGAYTKDSYLAVYTALEEVGIPVFISPGNHDFVTADSPWLKERWPDNVTVFTKPYITGIDLNEPDCRIYGGGFTSMDAPAMLESFHAEDAARVNIGVLHGDPTQINSPYCPITKKQIEDSGLAYLALGHIHKQGIVQAGNTLCAWPGCPMGRGYDEPGEKGVLLVDLQEKASAQFIALDTPRFYDLDTEAGDDAAAAITQLLPAVGCDDFYRVTLTGPSQALDLDALEKSFSHFPNLKLRDRTTPPVDVWGSAGQDTFEGIYFSMLRSTLESDDPERSQQAALAARISRRLLDGQEVVLP